MRYPVRRQIAPPDGIDALMDPVQIPGRDAVPHARVGEATTNQLRKRNHSMLPSCDLCNPQRHLTPPNDGFRRTMRRFPTFGGHGAIVPSRRARVARGLGGRCDAGRRYL